MLFNSTNGPICRAINLFFALFDQFNNHNFLFTVATFMICIFQNSVIVRSPVFTEPRLKVSVANNHDTVLMHNMEL